MVIPDHPSNTFFKQFSNTVTYDPAQPAQLVPTLVAALEGDPRPMSRMEQYMLSWEAASERLLDAAALPEGTPRRTATSYGSTLAYAAHYAMGVQPVYDAFRVITGAGKVEEWSDRPSEAQVLKARLAKKAAERAERAAERAEAAAAERVAGRAAGSADEGGGGGDDALDV